MTETMTRLGARMELGSIAKLLLLVGGIVLIVGGILDLVDIRNVFDLSPTIRTVASLSSVASGLLAVLVGLLALTGLSKVSDPAWNIVLLIVGLLVGGLGGILVFIGSLIRLVEIYAKR